MLLPAAGAKRHIADLEAQLNDSRNKLAANEPALNKLTAELKAERDAIEQERARASKLQESVSVGSRSLSSASSELNRTKADLAEAKAACDTLQQVGATYYCG